MVCNICKERKGRDVYIMGAANVGKSAFVRALLRVLGDAGSGVFSPAALVTGRHLPVESCMPGTTLGMIALQAFDKGAALYGTVGEGGSNQ